MIGTYEITGEWFGRLEEVVDYIEEEGYEVLESNREYISIHNGLWESDYFSYCNIQFWNRQCNMCGWFAKSQYGRTACRLYCQCYFGCSVCISLGCCVEGEQRLPLVVSILTILFFVYQ